MQVRQLKSFKNSWIIVQDNDVISRNRKKFLISLLAIALAFTCLLIVKEVRKPQPIPNYSASEKSTETVVVIPNGATGDEIGKILFQSDVVKSSRAFFAAATANEKSAGIQPGTYSLNTKISGREAVQQLLDSKRRLLVLLIREGERAYEIKDDLIKLKFPEAAIKKFYDKKISLPAFGEQPIEGFLFPATYNLTPDQDLTDVRKVILNKFTSEIAAVDFVTKSKLRSLTPYEMLIVASIVQAEGYDQADFSRIARVIFNRLQAGMPLQMDSTNLYALRERRIAVTKKDLSISSRYNSYATKGLPPTPIGNPGADAIQAALSPSDGDWLYFVTVEPKLTKFTKSYDEFLRFKNEFKANLRAGKFDGAQ